MEHLCAELQKDARMVLQDPIACETLVKSPSCSCSAVQSFWHFVVVIFPNNAGIVGIVRQRFAQLATRLRSCGSWEEDNCNLVNHHRH
jgi:hypothetical protein